MMGFLSKISQCNLIKNESDVCFLQCNTQNSSEQLQAATVFVPYQADSSPISDSAVIYFIKIENSSIKHP